MTGSSKVAAACPLVVTPPEEQMLLEDWVAMNRATIEHQLTAHKAIIFRGFGNKIGLDGIAASLFGRLLDYTYRSTPRTELGYNLYTATEYPKQLSIPMHCENSYQRDWPMRLLFHCLEPATRGGATPLADTIQVTRLIAPEVREEFERKNVKYVRNYRPGVDLPWQTVFGTNSREEVEQFCVRNGIDYQWSDTGLRTSQVCQAFAIHPVTGDKLWFNQAHLFHISALDKASQEMMLSFFGEGGLPRSSYFGDGTPISREALNNIRAAFEQSKTYFEWHKNDVLLIDNMLAAHGRDPFEGNRKVLVCMAESYSEWQRRSPTGKSEREGSVG
ncbi:TauD/TfdA family dioxygenase [Sorangium sp. So ce131]|uniref:TauD/TfdA family dioxygenase n=1 Tax=Sorangium sp. So ce131 TaxID=3133282 RepID=UPI003F5EF748